MDIWALPLLETLVICIDQIGACLVKPYDSNESHLHGTSWDFDKVSNHLYTTVIK